MSRWKRYVVGPNADGKSAVLDTEQTNVQENPGYFWRCTVWATEEVPADNTIEGDRSLIISTREPTPGGILFRNLELPPDPTNRDNHVAELTKLSTAIKQTVMPSEEDLKRHPSMHRTNTLDVITCVMGEVWLITDVDEVLMTPGDTVVIRGTNHGWSNRGDEPVLLSGVMIDAFPKIESH